MQFPKQFERLVRDHQRIGQRCGEPGVIRTSFALERDEFHPFKGIRGVEYLAVSWTKSVSFS